MKTCNECGGCKKESFQKTSLFIGISLGNIIGVLICTVVRIIEEVV